MSATLLYPIRPIVTSDESCEASECRKAKSLILPQGVSKSSYVSIRLDRVLKRCLANRSDVNGLFALLALRNAFFSDHAACKVS